MLAPLAGCGWFSSVTESVTGSGPPPPACPTTTILRPLAQTAVFAPSAARQPMGVAFYGLLSDVSAKCDIAGDALHLALDVILIGERGPAAGGAAGVDLTYFVAVTGANQAILSKRSFAVHIAIPANAQRAGVTDHIEQTIALGGQPPGGLTVVLGFQQSPEAIEFYKHYRGR